jgi:Family of unknown function (DUF6157)
MNYFQTLIAVADDCPVTRSVAPAGRGAKKTVAALQYEMLANAPYVHTQEDVLFDTWLRRQDLPHKTRADVARLRDDFFAKPQPCLRCSPLPKKYGWGFSFDEKGRVALCPMESKEYREALAGGRVKVVKAMRSSRG